MPDVRTPTPLVCVECLDADHDCDARGWRADWGGGHDGEPPEHVILCPACWCREFGAPADT